MANETSNFDTFQKNWLQLWKQSMTEKLQSLTKYENKYEKTRKFDDILVWLCNAVYKKRQ